MDLPPVVLVAAIILALVFLELFLYAIPLRVKVHLEYSQDTGMAFISACWLCVGVRGSLTGKGEAFHLLVGDIPVPLPDFLEAHGPGGRLKRAPGKTEPVATRPLLILESVIPRIPDLFSVAGAFLRSLSFRRLECRAVVGLLCPAETGMLYGYFWAVKSLLCSSGRVRLEMIPDFTKARLEGHLELDLDVRYPFNLVVKLGRLSMLFMGDKRLRGKGGIPA